MVSPASTFYRETGLLYCLVELIEQGSQLCPARYHGSAIISCFAPDDARPPGETCLTHRPGCGHPDRFHTDHTVKQITKEGFDILTSIQDDNRIPSLPERRQARLARQRQIRRRTLLALCLILAGGAAAIAGFMVLDARGLLAPGELGKLLSSVRVQGSHTTGVSSDQASARPDGAGDSTAGSSAAAGSADSASGGSGAYAGSTPEADASVSYSVPQDNTDYGSGEITLAVPSGISGVMQDAVSAYTEALPGMANMTVTVTEEPGTDVLRAYSGTDDLPDLYVFQSGDRALLRAKGALAEDHDDDACYPLTWDGGYFLYYNSSVIQDVSKLDSILAACETSGRTFNMELTSGWYQMAFFLGAGCSAEYTVSDDGSISAGSMTLASDAGVAAMKAMIHLASSSAFSDVSMAALTDRPAAIISGIWDRGTAKELFGSGYAAAKLPAFTADGVTYPMGSLVEGSMLGVKPQDSELKLKACTALARWLSSPAQELALYRKAGWIPADTTALMEDSSAGAGASAEASSAPADTQADAAASGSSGTSSGSAASLTEETDPAVRALAAQNAAGTLRGVYPQDFWSFLTAFGDNILAGKYQNADDSTLLSALQELQSDCVSAAEHAADTSSW